jgi:hypothetical protein
MPDLIPIYPIDYIESIYFNPDREAIPNSGRIRGTPYLMHLIVQQIRVAVKPMNSSDLIYSKLREHSTKITIEENEVSMTV